MIITIGVGIVCFGIGLFVGKAIAPTSTNINGQEQQPNVIQQWIVGIKEKKKQKREEQAVRDKMLQEARLKAIKGLGNNPELQKRIQEEEIKKITGQDKKDKLQKFADAFSMKGTSIGETDKINQMLGISDNNNNNHQQVDPVQYMGVNQQHYPGPQVNYHNYGPQPSKQQPKKKSPFDFDEKIDRMLR